MQVTEKIMGLVLIGILIIQGVSAIQVFEAEVVNYKNGSVDFRDIRINNVDDLSNRSNAGDDFKLIAKYQEKQFWSFSRNLSYLRWYPGYGEYRNIEKIIDMVRIPLRNDSITLDFYRSGEKKLELNTENFTESLCTNDGVCKAFCSGKEADIDCTCGDGICQEGLNERQLCPGDCESPEEDEEAPGNTSSPNGEEVVNESYGIYILAGIAVIAILILLFMASGKVKIEG